MKNLRESSIFSEKEWLELAGSLCLSPRELQIMQGVFHDMKEMAIARHLGISPHTVHTYIERIYRKLDVNSRVQVVVRVVAEYRCLAARTSDMAMESRRSPVEGACLTGASWNLSESFFFTGTSS